MVLIARALCPRDIHLFGISMSLPPPILIEAPDQDVISLADCKAAIGIVDDSQDSAIQIAIRAVSDALDPASLGWLGRALRRQTWELQLESFHAEECHDHRHR